MKKTNLLIALSMFITTGVMTTGCNSSNSPDAGIVNVYNWANYIGSNTLQEFEQETGIRVNYDNFSNNEELLAKLQGGAIGYDVIVPSDYMVQIMKDKKLLAPLEKEKLSNISNIDPEFSNPTYDPGLSHCVPYHWGTAGIAVNTDKVKKPVDSWQILWDPEYAGRISMLDDPRATMAAALFKLGLDINTKDPIHINAAKLELQKQKPLVKAYTSDTYIEHLRSGEVWLAQGYTGDVYQVAKEIPSIKYIIPKEGAEIAVDSLCIPASAPNKHNAHLFINYILRADVAAKITNEIRYPSPNKELRDAILPELIQDPLIYPSKEIRSRLRFILDLGEASALYDRAWSEVKAQ